MKVCLLLCKPMLLPQLHHSAPSSFRQAAHKNGIHYPLNAASIRSPSHYARSTHLRANIRIKPHGGYKPTRVDYSYFPLPPHRWLMHIASHILPALKALINSVEVRPSVVFGFSSAWCIRSMFLCTLHPATAYEIRTAPGLSVRVACHYQLRLPSLHRIGV